MATTGPAAVVAVFDDRSHAENAVDELCRSGFRPEQVGLAVRDAGPPVEAPPLDPDTKEGKGAVTGALAGGTLGGLLGAAVATGLIPGVGPVIAGGLLVGIVGGVVSGAAGGGILGTLIGLNVPEDQARHFEHHFHSGRTLVTVRAEDRGDDAVAVLRRHGGHDGTLPPGPPVTETAEETEEHPAPMTSKSPLSRLDRGGPDAGSGTVFPGE
jgi:hypothetical protein